MLNSARRISIDALHASADTLIAGVACGLVVLIFWPITLCAEGVKKLLRHRTMAVSEPSHGKRRHA